MRTRSITINSQQDIHLWIVDMQEMRPAVETFTKWLSADERERANSFLFPDRTITSICSRGILRWILACYLNLSPGSVEIGKSLNGKPYLDNHQLQFNLSHSGRYFVCAVALQTPLGIDIQQIYPISGLERISRSHFQPEQIKEILALRGKQQHQSFFQHWVNLEAYLKAVGNGFQTRAPKLNHAQQNKSKHYSSQDTWHTVDLSVPEGYKAALVTRQESPVILQQSAVYP